MRIDQFFLISIFLIFTLIVLFCYLLFSIHRAEQTEAAFLHSREAYRPIARRAAVLFDVARHMVEVNNKYTLSFAHFLKVFDAAIQQSER